MCMYMCVHMNAHVGVLMEDWTNPDIILEMSSASFETTLTLSWSSPIGWSARLRDPVRRPPGTKLSLWVGVDSRDQTSVLVLTE